MWSSWRRGAQLAAHKQAQDCQTASGPGSGRILAHSLQRRHKRRALRKVGDFWQRLKCRRLAFELRRAQPSPSPKPLVPSRCWPDGLLSDLKTSKLLPCLC